VLTGCKLWTGEIWQILDQHAQRLNEH
jgi:hypothetical protein